MSRIRADRYTNREGTGAPTFSSGVNVVGISSVGITTVTGIGQTALTVNGDARITGVLTVGQGSVTIGSTNITTQQINDLNFPTAGALSNRNHVGNGKFQVDQRNNGSAVTPAGGQEYTLDRWRAISPSGGVAPYSIQQVSTDLPTGFNYGTKITVDIVTTPTSSQQFFYGTAFEAYDLGYWEYGTSNALTATLSFYVRSSVTGTYCISSANDANTRSFVGEYTISSANTWEYKTIVIPGDTTGTWPSTGSVRHSFLQFDLGAGSNFDGTNGSWVSGNKRKTSGSVNFVSQVVGSTFMVTGVQLELGTKATDFEHRSYGEELALCQRYFYRHATFTNGVGRGIGNANRYTSPTAFGVVHFPVTMRTLPTLDVTNTTSGFQFYSAGSGQDFDTFSQQETNYTTFTLECNGLSGTGGQGGWWRTNPAAGSNSSISFSAEL